MNRHPRLIGVLTIAMAVLAVCATGCDDDGDTRQDGDRDGTRTTSSPDTHIADRDTWPDGSDVPTTPLAAACEAAPGGGSATVAEPQLLARLGDRWHESWLGSPAVADLDGDGENEILAARHGLMLGWHLDGTVVFRAEIQNSGRIWASPVVADLDPSRPGLEVAAAARGEIYAWTASGDLLPGFPVTARDELRSLAAEDLDGDGLLELVAVSTRPLEQGGLRDIIWAFHHDGSTVDGFPPNTTGASGCTEACYVTGGYDQNLALGDVDGDGLADVFATQDNAYLSLHKGNGQTFTLDTAFRNARTFLGMRGLHDLALAHQGWANDEQSANQAHWTNSAPAIADLDQDGKVELVVLGSVQNAAQSDRERGVALWALYPDGNRHPAFVTPFHAPDYLFGLWDYDGTNVVAATNQVSIADLDPDSAGLETVFAGFDGRIHAVSADARELWSYVYTTSDRVLTGGVVITDLSGDGSPEVVFTSYSPDDDVSHLFVLNAAGQEQHRLPLPGRGAMAVPTIADVDGDGTLEIVVSLKDGEDRVEQVRVYTVPGSAPNCMPWPTGRGNLLRSAWVR